MTLQLRTLGAVDLRGDAGEVRVVLRQPKRLALLIYLAAAGGKFVRRDTLLACFWPELDQEHARAALRRAVYFLRRALGDDVVEGRGDDELRVGEGALVFDAAAFGAALARGDARGALALYAGEFLPGFYVAGAGEAERWIDAERERLRAAALRGAWSMAEAPGVSAGDAAAWAAKAVAIAGDDEAALQRLLTLLERLGERDAALRAFDAFAGRMAADGIAPDRATEEIAARLRAAPARPRPARADLVIAALPFDVHAGPSMAYLGEGMVDLLASALDGVEGLRVVDPRALMAGLGQGRATEAAARLGATHVLRGSIVEAGGRVRLAASLEVAGGGPTTRVEAEDASEGRIFELVDEVVRQLLAARATGPAGQLARLAARTTTSLAALKSWLAGEHAFRLGRHRDAAAAFEEAVAADSSFGLAHYRLAGARAALAQIEPARDASAAAVAHRERLAESARVLVDAQAGWLAGRLAEAERHYAAAVASRPDDLEAWYLLGDVLFHTNPYRGRSIREAREPLERALALDPWHLGALAKLARLDAIEGRTSELDGRVERFLGLSPDADQALAMRALRAWRLGRAGEKAALIATLRHARALDVAIAFGDVALYAGALDDLEPVGRAMLTAVRSPELRALVRLMLAHVMLAGDRHLAARAELEAAYADEPAWSLEVQGMLAAMPWWPWDAPFVAGAREALEAFDPATAPIHAGAPLTQHNGLHAHIRAYVLGLLDARALDAGRLAAQVEALAELDVPPGVAALVERMERTLHAHLRRLRGDPAGALAALEGARTDVWYQLAVGSPVFAGTGERILRAELLAECGRPAEAVGWLEAIGERTPWELPFIGPARAIAARVGAR